MPQLHHIARLTRAFARDNELPFSDFFVDIDSRLKIPIRALFLVSSCIFVLSFIQTGSTAVYNAILSLSTLGLYISYLFPLVFRHIARFTRQDVPRGRFTLGRLGLPVNLVAILFTVYFTVFLPFPSTLPVTHENKNFAGPVSDFVMLFSSVDWVVRGVTMDRAYFEISPGLSGASNNDTY